VPSLATDLFDYDLPPRLIAQVPSARRDQSRLLVVDRATRRVEHTVFAELPRYLRAGDTLFRNNAAVLPARLRARRPSGGAVECFLLRPLGPGNDADETWLCLVKPGKKLPVGATFAPPGGEFTGLIIGKEADGSALVRFTTRGGEPITAVANQLGDVPLPPYIARENSAQRAADLERYQTVYADRARQVAVAAPTAGLHFTPELLAALTAQGVGTAEVTLHVGLGTFKPITAATVEAHAIHREIYELPVATQRALCSPGGRRVAVGTTTVRSVEDFLATHAQFVGAQTCCALGLGRSKSAPLQGSHIAEADIFIYPPFTFRGTDALITNFHQPRSTLLCLVAAFLAPGTTDGIAWLRELYADAVACEYRFFSYGDAMLIL
jgi:S-adenosylmethionine:tRNA ribosyltransferase-isomerase